MAQLQTLTKQARAVKSLMKKGFKTEKVFSPNGKAGDEIYLMSKRQNTGHIHASVEANGDVNGQPLCSFLKDIEILMK